MTHALRWSVLPLVGAAALASILLGASLTLNTQIAFLMVIAFLGVAMLTAPAGAWVLCALVAALTFRGLVQLHALPPVATYLDLPLAWGALAVGLLRRRRSSPLLTRLLRWLVALALAVALAWAFHPSEVMRPVLYLMLLGEPFAIVCALLADPPSPRLRRVLVRTLFALVMIQIPIIALQIAAGPPLVTLQNGETIHADFIQGTLYGAGSGEHVISAVIVVGAIWILAGGFGRDILGRARFPVLAALIVIPFIAKAKQVILALPVIILASSWRVGRLQLLVRGALVAGAIVALFVLTPNHAEEYLQKNAQGQGGKQATALFLWRKLENDPASVAFGRGPAETVSRAAFMTTPQDQHSESPLGVLGLKPAALNLEAQEVAHGVAGQGSGTTRINSSFNNSTSSALGLFGDLGIIGVLAYAGLLLTLFISLRQETSAEGVAAAAGFALFLVLGFLFDWWEEPPFGVFIGVLAGLSLSESQFRPTSTETQKSHHLDARVVGDRARGR